MRNRIITEQDCSAFNTIAEKYRNEILSYTKLYNILDKEAGIKNPRAFISKMLNYTIPIITKSGRGKYQFAGKPVHIKALQYAWDYVLPKEEESNDVNSLEDEIENAILLLSDNGYKVLKRSFNQEDALKHPERPVSDFIKWIEVI